MTEDLEELREKRDELEEKMLQKLEEDQDSGKLITREEFVDELVKAAYAGFNFDKGSYDWEQLEPVLRETFRKVYVEGLSQEELEELTD
ncbi:hypothetical protein [Candidatus Nanohalovita haloferacivicina]|uniref:hypothetical protein n=1 Tax=Candidatus Nanohalovita haloferacivicina TaxID=2978046 RepID=UPI00325FCB87|nr:hypothetical protein HBNXNv_0347 [Candidatus Nanohalobia archaeon BNXNv]